MRMLSRDDFVRMSLSLNLFFLRIMKEHSFFLEAAFTPKNPDLAQTADAFKRQFEMLLWEAVQLSNGVLSAQAIQSGQYYTPFTFNAEQASQYYTGIALNTSITQTEGTLQPASAGSVAGLETQVAALNQKVMTNVAALASFKNRLLADVLSCKIFMNTYSLLIDHILREAIFFHGMLAKLQNREDLRTEKDLIEQEAFWNRIMAEHAKFIRGLLDPTEEVLFETANMFGKEFDTLTAQASQAQNYPAMVPKVTSDSLASAQKIRDFKAAGTNGILNCKIRSMILPLLGDHVLREANHYVYVLQGGGTRPMEVWG